MSKNIVLLSIPGLRQQDLAKMPHLTAQMANGKSAQLQPSFPALTCPVQVNLTTGKLPAQHGVVSNGYYWRDEQRVEMWTSWNEVIQSPQIWDLLHKADSKLTSAVWFPLMSKGCGADYICTFAPIHNPDGSESLWCYTRPEDLYGELREAYGDFPLKHFWGPLAGIQSSSWIIDSAVFAAKKFKQRFSYLYLPHLDYAAQKHGPESPEAEQALVALDTELAKLFQGFKQAYGAEASLLWYVASEYTISPVTYATLPNCLLRSAGLLKVVKTESEGKQTEEIDFKNSPAWAMVSHQISHIYVRDGDPAVIQQVAELFSNQPGIARVLTKKDLVTEHLSHPHSGEVVLVSEPDSWQAYYWWHDAAYAPDYARTVDIHNKPGYDPVELHFDPATRSIPLDTSLVKGSHGAVTDPTLSQGVLLCSDPQGMPEAKAFKDIEVTPLILKQFRIDF